MIVIILNNRKRGTFWIDGPYEEWGQAATRAKKIEKENQHTDTWVIRLYKRNQYGAPEYPWFGDDSGDE